VDAKSGQLVWRGSSDSRVYQSATPEERTEKVNNIVASILKSYPPQRAL